MKKPKGETRHGHNKEERSKVTDRRSLELAMMDKPKYCLMSSQLRVNHTVDNLRINMVFSNSRLVQSVCKVSTSTRKIRQTDFDKSQFLIKLIWYFKNHFNIQLDASIKVGNTFSLDTRKVERELRTLSSVNFGKLTSEDIFSMSTSNKYVSVAIQTLIEQKPQEEISKIEDEVIKIIDRLIIHRYGNYILQQLVKRSNIIRIETEALCRLHICTLAFNESSSRVMQTLAEDNPSFSDFVLAWTRGQELKLAKNPPAALLVSVAVRSGSSISPLISNFVNSVKASPKSWLASKYHKRIITSLFQVAKDTELDLLFHSLGFGSHIESILNEKYLAFAFSTLISRKYRPALEALESALANEPLNICESRFFLPLLHKFEKSSILTHENAPSPQHLNQVFAEELFSRLYAILRSHISKILLLRPSGSAGHLYLVYLLVLLSPYEDFALLRPHWIAVWKQISDSPLSSAHQPINYSNRIPLQ